MLYVYFLFTAYIVSLEAYCAYASVSSCTSTCVHKEKFAHKILMQCSVLGLFLGQGVEWNIQTEGQHKEYKNMTQKELVSEKPEIAMGWKGLKFNINGTKHYTYFIFTCHPCMSNSKMNIERMSPKLTTIKESGKLSLNLGKEIGILLMLRCDLPTEFPNPTALTQWAQNLMYTDNFFFSKTDWLCGVVGAHCRLHFATMS